MTNDAASARLRSSVMPRWLRGLWDAQPLVVASGVVIAALAVVLGVLWPLTDVIAAHDVGLITGPKLPAALQAAREAARTQLLTLGAGLFAASALLFTGRSYILSRRALALTEQGQVTDRYTRAIEHPGSAKLDVRISRVYALERIAQDSHRDYPTVMEVLSAFIREHSREGRAHGGRAPRRPPRPDIQAAVTVIGRRDVRHGAWILDLTQADLWGANLIQAEFAGARLTGANLEEADLTYADLTGANLDGAKLSRVILGRARLAGASLDFADLAHADLSDTNLDGATLNNATLTEAALPAARLTDAHLTKADLTNAVLHLADLSGARMAGVNLTGAVLTDASLKKAALPGAHLDRAKLHRADLTEARLTGACLNGAHLTDAKLNRAHLEEADLTGAVLIRADLTGARLRDADITGADLTYVDLTGADLTNVRLSAQAAVPEGWLRDPGTGRLTQVSESTAESGS